MAKRWTFYRFVFADGYAEVARNYNMFERADKIARHGLILSREKA